MRVKILGIQRLILIWGKIGRRVIAHEKIKNNPINSFEIK
jgi:hypothetical protein